MNRNRQLWGAIVVIFGVTLAILLLSTKPGASVTAERIVGDFTGIHLMGTGSIHLTQGSETKVVVHAGENVLPDLVTEVRGDTLELSIDHGWQFWRYWGIGDIDYEITVTDLDAVRISGSGSLSGSDLTLDQLSIEVSGAADVALGLTLSALDTKVTGSGDIVLSGTADQQTIQISGSGEYDAGDFVSQSAVLKISGSGNATVNARQRLDVKISGSGQVRYMGEPQISQSITGSGSLDQIEDRTPGASDQATEEPAADTALARIEQMEILILESFPVQVVVHIEGTVSDACREIGEIEKSREEDLFVVRVPSSPGDQDFCAEVLTPFEENIALDVYGLAAGTYTVDVNGEVDTFTLTVDNVLNKPLSAAIR